MLSQQAQRVMSAASTSGQDARLSLLADHIHEALMPILQNQPGDPLLYLCSYFNDQADGGDHTSNAYRTLRLCAPQHPNFYSNLATAFGALSRSNGADASSVPPSLYLELMHMLSSTLPQTLALRVNQVFQRAAAVPVDFPTFALSARLCLLLERFCQQYAKDAVRSRHLAELAEPKRVLLELLDKLAWLDALAPMKGFGGVRIMPLSTSGAVPQPPAAAPDKPAVQSLEAMRQQQLAKEAESVMEAVLDAMYSVSTGSSVSGVQPH